MRDPVIGTGRTSADTGVNAKLVLVNNFCYLGYMLNVDRDADTAVETRIQTGWNKYRELVSLLTKKDVSLLHTHIHNRFTAGLLGFCPGLPG